MSDKNPFGVSIQTSIPLPGFAESGVAPDVVIQYGAVPESLPGAIMIRACSQVRPGQFLLVLDKVARYLVENGNRITIQPAPGVSDDEVRLFLMSSVWGALMLQRGLLPLHGSAIRVGNGAVVLAGPSGNGKSTLAAALMERGYPLIADELCALAIREDSPPLLLPGFPQILLWADSLWELKKEIGPLIPVRPGLKKYILPGRRNMASEPLPLERIYILISTNKPSFRLVTLTGVHRIHALVDATYRVHHVTGLGLDASHFRQCAGAARHIIVKQVKRPEIPFDIEGLIDHVIRDFQ